MSKANWSASWFNLPAAILLAAAVGCGYHLSGTYARLPEGVRTVAIPMISNTTIYPEIETPVTRRFRDRMEGLRIFVAPTGQADAVLKVTVNNYDVSPASYDQDENVTEFRLTLKADLALTPSGAKEPVLETKGAEGRVTYLNSADPQVTEQNRLAAIDEAAGKLAENGLDQLFGGF